MCFTYQQASSYANNYVCERVVNVLKEWLEKCGDEWETSYGLRVAWPAVLRIMSRGGHSVAPLERAWESLESQAKLGGGIEATRRRKAALAVATALSATSGTSGHFASAGAHSSSANGSSFASFPSASHSSRTGSIPALSLPVVASIQNGAVDPAELARQLTLLDQDLFSQITLQSCLAGPFSAESLPSCFAVYLEWTQRITEWVTFSVLTSDSLRSRVKVFICFLECANHLRSMRNHNSLIAIAQGLINPNVARLKNTIGAFHAKLSSIYQTISQLANPERNYEQLRDAQEKASKPTIPSIVTLVSDLVTAHAQPFIAPNTEHPDQRAQGRRGSTLLNYASLRRVATVMEMIDSAQELAYPFAEVSSIKTLLERIEVSATEEELIAASLYLEPLPGTERSFKKPKLLLTEEELRKMAEEDTEDYRLSPGRPPNSPGAEWAVSLGRDGQEFEVIFIPGYRFYSRDTSYNVRIEMEDGVAVIRAASLEKLVEHLTPAKNQMLSDDPDFLRTFFSTFHGYSSSATILDLLAMRYQPPHLKSTEPEHIQQFQEKYETPLRNRVCAVLLYWLRKHPADFTNVSLRERVRDFLVEKVAICQPDWSKLLLTELDARVLSASASMRPSSNFNAGNSRAGVPLARSNTNVAPSSARLVSGLEILDFEVATVAMQLSLLVHEAWTRIRTSELMNLSWIGPQAQSQSPNIMAFQGLLEKVVYNVEVELTRLLNASRHENLAKTIGAWLAVAQRSHEHLLCWPVAQSIVNVIQLCYTQELSTAWEKIPRQLVKYFHFARSLFSDRDRYLDAALAPFSEAAVSWRISTSAPLAMTAELANSSPDALETPKLLNRSGVLPLDIILEDIAQIEESQPNLLLEMGPRVINFEKFRLMSEIFHLVMLTQRSDYATTKPQGYNTNVETRVRSWLLREPKPDEIPAQRFHSRFAQRVSIAIERESSSRALLSRTNSESSATSDHGEHVRLSMARGPSTSQTSPPRVPSSRTSPPRPSHPRTASSSSAQQGGSGSATTSPSTSPRSLGAEPEVANGNPANGPSSDQVSAPAPRKASTGPNPHLAPIGEARLRSTSGGAKKGSGLPTPSKSPPIANSKTPTKYYTAFLPKRGLARSNTEISPSTLNPRPLSADPRDRPLPAAPTSAHGTSELSNSITASTTTTNASMVSHNHIKSASSTSVPSLDQQTMRLLHPNSNGLTPLPSSQASTGPLSLPPTPQRTVAPALQVPAPETFLSLLKANPSLLNGLISEVFAEETDKFLQSKEMKDLARLKQKTKSDDDYRLVLAVERETEEGRRSQIKRTMTMNYAEYRRFSSFRHLDESGAVYGFTYPVILEVADSMREGDDNVRAICDVTPKADIAHVSLLFRAAALHRSADPSCPQKTRVYLLSESFTEAATKAAAKCGIELVKISTTAPTKKGAASNFQRRKLAPSLSSSSIPNGPRISAAREGPQQ